MKWKDVRKEDPFLEAHSSPDRSRIIDIGAGFNPLSIRDQMFRGSMAVDRIIRCGLVRPVEENHLEANAGKLVVVGGGAAGAAAAIRAARYHVPTILIDQGKHPFSRQIGCATRYVSPTQYDWPAEHSDSHRYPWDSTHPVVELPWGCPAGDIQSADELGIAWSRRFNTARRFFKNWLEVRFGVLAGAGWKKNRLEVFNAKTGQALVANAKLVIRATGLGPEKCEENLHKGYDFWDIDPFCQTNAGCKHPPNVLISGGGDGSLQDFIRIATGLNSAMEFYSRLKLPALLKSRVEAKAAAAEDHYQRAVVWSTDKWDCELLSRLRTAYDGIVQDVMSDPDFARGLRSRVVPLLRIGRDIESVRFVHSCTHFKKSYGLNQFCVLLLDALVKRFRGPESSILPNHRVANISGHSPANPASASHCHDQSHQVSFTRSSCQEPRSAVPAGASMSNVRVLVLRHGIELKRTERTREIRQTIPMYMPWDVRSSK